MTKDTDRDITPKPDVWMRPRVEPAPGTLTSVSRSRSRKRWGNVAILKIGTPNYAKELVFPLELGVAYLDGRPTASWLIEPEDRWAPGDRTGERASDAGPGSGLKAGVVVEELRSATQGCRLYSKSHAEDGALLKRMAAACDSELSLKVRDFWSLLIPANPDREPVSKDHVEWAERWSWRVVPETPRIVIHAARDVAFLRELLRMAAGP